MRNSFNEKTQKKILSLLSEIAQTDGELPRLKKALAVGLYQTAEPLQKTELTRENFNRYFVRGEVQSPIETVRMGEHQFEKLQRDDRDHLLDGVYRTLTNPSIILNTVGLDKQDHQIKPVHIYGKAFYSLTSDHSSIIKSVVVFKQGKSISISSHQNGIVEFLKHLNTVQDLSYTNKILVEKTSLALEQAGCLADLKHINTRPINLAYDEKNLLNEISFTQETKTAGENLRPSDSAAQNEVGSPSRHPETVRDRVSAFAIKYTENGSLSRENSAFTQETKTAGENLRPSDSAAQNEVGSHARHLETVKDRVSALRIKEYTENGNLSRENPAFPQETKTAGENLRPSDSAAQNEVGNHAGLMEQSSKDLNTEYSKNGNLSRENSAFAQETKTVGENLRPSDSAAQNEVGSHARHQETVRDRVSTLRIKEYTENGGLSSGKTVLEKFMEENGIKTAKAEKTNVRGKNQDMEL